MASLEGFLNIAIPLGVFVFIGAAFYSRLKEPLQAFFAWIKDLFGWTKEKMVDDNPIRQIVYD